MATACLPHWHETAYEKAFTPPTALPPVPRKCHEQTVPYKYFSEHEPLRPTANLALSCQTVNSMDMMSLNKLWELVDREARCAAVHAATKRQT